MCMIDTLKNMSYIRGLHVIALLALALLGNVANVANAYFIVHCNHLVDVRLDPVVSPGKQNCHVHSVFGSQNFGSTVTTDPDLNTGATTCNVREDRSMYWAPSLYYKDPVTSKLRMVPSGIKVYYLDRGTDFVNRVSVLPRNLRMVMGNASATSVPLGPVVDGVIHWVCLCYCKDGPNGNQQYKTLPDMWCPVWQARIMFPNCWDGSLDSKDHRSHMAFRLANDSCPSTHPQVLPQPFFEVDYFLGAFPNSRPSDFMLANGDAVGATMHADFISGWDEALMTDAIKNCKNNDWHSPGCPLAQFAGLESAPNVMPTKSLPAEMVDNITSLVMCARTPVPSPAESPTESPAESPAESPVPSPAESPAQSPLKSANSSCVCNTCTCSAPTSPSPSPGSFDSCVCSTCTCGT
jgi:hypothetical protein